MESNLLAYAEGQLRRHFGDVRFEIVRALYVEEEVEEAEEDEEFFAIPVPAGQPLPGESVDLYALRSFLATCRGCELCQSRKQVVFGAGHSEPRLLVLGEAPGEHEDEQGKPFVGKSGHKLDLMLGNVLSLSRSDVFITNVVKCRPPGNRDPYPAEIEACLPWLHRQLDLLKPRVILTMGRVPLETLFPGLTGISRNRGIWRSYRGIDVMSTFHPAFILRDEAKRAFEKRQVWEDLLAVKARLAQHREAER